jgi:pyruvate-formate lyase
MSINEKNAGTRVSGLVQKMLVLPSLCTERGSLMTESYRETEGEPPVVKRAKALSKILKGISNPLSTRRRSRPKGYRPYNSEPVKPATLTPP